MERSSRARAMQASRADVLHRRQAGDVLQQRPIELATADQHRPERNDGQLTVEPPRLQLRQLDIPIRDLSRQLIRVIAAQVQRVFAARNLCVIPHSAIFSRAVDVRIFDIELSHVGPTNP
jgi:hypothetical protein